MNRTKASSVVWYHASFLLLYLSGVAIAILIVPVLVAESESRDCQDTSCVGRPSTYLSALRWLGHRLWFSDTPGVQPASGAVAALGWLMSILSLTSVMVAFTTAFRLRTAVTTTSWSLDDAGAYLARLAALTSFSLTDVASKLAGERQVMDAETWRAHLSRGSHDRLPAWHRQLRDAVGFLVAAGRMRWRDLRNQLCRPLDWLVLTNTRAASLIILAVCVPVLCLHRAGGWALVWQDFEQIGVVVGLTSGAVHGWRRLRGITPKD